jgi:hypothetical protein
VVKDGSRLFRSGKQYRKTGQFRAFLGEITDKTEHYAKKLRNLEFFFINW